MSVVRQKAKAANSAAFAIKLISKKKKKVVCFFFFSKHIDTKYRDTPYALHIAHTHFSTVAALWSCRHFLKCLLDWTKAELWERIEQLVEFWRWRDFCAINGSCRRHYNGLLLKKKKCCAKSTPCFMSSSFWIRMSLLPVCCRNCSGVNEFEILTFVSSLVQE